MVKFYVTQIKLGKITVENIPEMWQDSVTEAMSE